MQVKRKHKRTDSNPFCDLNCDGCNEAYCCDLYQKYLHVKNKNVSFEPLATINEAILTQSAQNPNSRILNLLYSSYKEQRAYFKAFVNNLEEFLLHICSLHQRIGKNKEHSQMDLQAALIFKKSLSNALLVRSPILALAGKIDYQEPSIVQNLDISLAGIKSLISAWLYFYDAAPNFEDNILHYLTRLKKAENDLNNALEISRKTT